LPSSHLFDLSYKFDGVVIGWGIFTKLDVQTIPKSFMYNLLYSLTQARDQGEKRTKLKHVSFKSHSKSQFYGFGITNLKNLKK
jgi:hypothetical protein